MKKSSVFRIILIANIFSNLWIGHYIHSTFIIWLSCTKGILVLDYIISQIAPNYQLSKLIKDQYIDILKSEHLFWNYVSQNELNLDFSKYYTIIYFFQQFQIVIDSFSPRPQLIALAVLWEPSIFLSLRTVNFSYNSWGLGSEALEKILKSCIKKGIIHLY